MIMQLIMASTAHRVGGPCCISSTYSV